MDLPAELVPNEDRGRVDIAILAPEGAGYDYTLKAGKQTTNLAAALENINRGPS